MHWECNWECILNWNFIDLSKAFDTINHNIIFIKMEHYGVRDVTLQLFKSHLYNRSQYVVYKGLQSAELGIKCGVTQGSIVGSIWFLIYINDITNVSRLLQLLLFAEDTNIFLEQMDIEALVATVYSALVKLADWFSANRLTLNVSQTNFIISCSSKRKYNPNLINISLNRHQITQIKHTKFLGVYIDERLNWKEHVKQLSTKLSKNIGMY